MPRPKKAADQSEKPYTRVPIRLTPDEHTRLRVLCIRLDEPLEEIAGRWLAERLTAEEKKLAGK